MDIQNNKRETKKVIGNKMKLRDAFGDIIPENLIEVNDNLEGTSK